MSNRGDMRSSFSPDFHTRHISLDELTAADYYTRTMRKVKLHSLKALAPLLILAASGAPAAEYIPAHPRSPSEGFYQEMSMARLAQAGSGPVDTLSMLVIRVEFSDLGFSETYDSLYLANELRHLAEYYHGASAGRFGLGWEIAPGITELSFEAGYYGEDDIWEDRVAEMLIETVLDNDAGIDFSHFDAFALVHPGAGQETDFAGDSSWQLWSGFIDPVEMEETLADTLGTPGVPTGDLDGTDVFYVDNIMVLPEDASQDGMVFGSLGIYAYQIGSRLGMIPMYDTTPGGFPDSQGIGSFGLMGYGLYNASGFIPAFPCVFHRYLMGWVEPVTVTAGGRIRVRDINAFTEQDTAVVRVDIGQSEYFLLVGRMHDGDMDGRFDFTDLNGNGIPENEDTLLGAEFDYFLTSTTNPPGETGSGLLVWHIDETIIRGRLAVGRYPNDEPGMSGVDLEEADGVQDLDRPGGSHAFGSWGDSFRSGWYDLFGPGTIPSSSSNTGSPTGISVRDISAPGSVMSFTLDLEPARERTTGYVPGDVSGLGPVPVDLDGSGGMEIVQAADTGRVYIAHGFAGGSWDGSFEPVLDIPGASWTGSPVVTDIGGDTGLEIVLTSRDGRLHVYHTDGSAYPVDDDEDPGSLETGDSMLTMPLALEIDGEDGAEAVFAGSDGDTMHLFIVGADTPPAASRSIGAGVAVMAAARGRPASHPVLVRNGSGNDGVFILVWQEEAGMRAYTFFWMQSGNAIASRSWPLPGAIEPEAPLTAASGDIDRDGTDEMVVGLPGTGLVYIDTEGRIRRCGIPAGRISPPALADMDGDGVLETLLRDREALMVLTGFGTLVHGWPLSLPEKIGLLEPDGRPAQPVSADLDGDGALEVLFNVAGELRAYGISAAPVEGWTVRLGGDATVPFAFSRGDGDAMYLVASQGTDRVVAPDQRGTVFGSPESSVSRFETGAGFDSAADGWLMTRHDPGGTGRQGEPSGGGAPPGTVDAGSFICYPNPATGPSFRARADIAGRASVAVRLMNLEGAPVWSWSGSHDWPEGNVPFEVEVPLDGIAGGIYICLMEVRGEGWSWSGTRKVALIR